MTFQSIIPILYSDNVKISIDYYVNILGFENSWCWDDEPGFGGVDNGEVRIFFCKGAQGHPGTWLAINVYDVDEYYEVTKKKGAKIISEPQSYEWGMREMLVEDPDGHKIRFGNGITVRKKSGAEFPDTVRLVERKLSQKELAFLARSVGWSPGEEQYTDATPALVNAYTIIAEDSSETHPVGCAFLLTDSAGMYYIKNVLVHPHWQGKQVGTHMMRKLNDWLEANAPDNSTAFLHTGEHLAPFYRQFGFTPAYSMQKKIKRSDQV